MTVVAWVHSLARGDLSPNTIEVKWSWFSGQLSGRSKVYPTHQ